MGLEDWIGVSEDGGFGTAEVGDYDVGVVVFVNL